MSTNLTQITSLRQPKVVTRLHVKIKSFGTQSFLKACCLYCNHSWVDETQSVHYSFTGASFMDIFFDHLWLILPQQCMRIKISLYTLMISSSRRQQNSLAFYLNHYTVSNWPVINPE